MAKKDPSNSSKKHLQGVVVSDKMDKTVVVQVVRQFKHPLYKKYVRNTKKYKAHNHENKARQGDTVLIMESRPLSREKRWVVKQIIERAA